MQANAGGRPLDSLLPEFHRQGRRALVGQSYRSWQFAKTGKTHSFEKIMQNIDNGSLSFYNDQLPIPIPDNGDIFSDVYQMINQEQDFIRKLMNNRENINDVLLPGEIQKMYILDAVDSITCLLHPMLLHSDQTELMVIESELAEKIISSKNTIITAEDLQHVPFDQTFLEFNRPITVVDLGENRKIDAVAVGFYKNEASQCYSIVWYRDARSEEGDRVESILATTFFPVANLQRTIFDDFCKSILGLITYTDLGGMSNLVSPSTTDEELASFNQTFNQAREQLMKASRNIWDFVTSRNINYEIVTRNKRDHSKVKRYKHLQGKMLMGPRVFKMLTVDKNVRRPEVPGEGQSATGLGYREHIPASFHKWIYCKSCNRTHRHDLIGRPCRRCKKQVGPIANMIVQKWWHEAYWRGEGEIKQVVREMK